MGGWQDLLDGLLVLLVLVGGVHDDLVPAGGGLDLLGGEEGTGVKYTTRILSSDQPGFLQVIDESSIE